MTFDRPLRVGSRGSPLALIQDEEALSRLRAHHPDLEFELVIVRTSGDANQTAPLAGMGLGVFRQRDRRAPAVRGPGHGRSQSQGPPHQAT